MSALAPESRLSALEQRMDPWLGPLLGIQAATQFLVIPLSFGHPLSRLWIDASHIAFAAVCVVFLTRRRLVQASLFCCLIVLGGAQLIRDAPLGLGGEGSVGPLLVPVVALLFNGIVTALIARYVFGPGRVSNHKLLGAVLIYLNVAALFAIGYGLLLAHWPTAFAMSGGVPASRQFQSAQLNYFSLSTITTTGYGDIVPVHPLARSMANLEAIFGELFPAIVLARLVALNLARDN